MAAVNRFDRTEGISREYISNPPASYYVPSKNSFDYLVRYIAEGLERGHVSIVSNFHSDQREKNSRIW
jgi:hypothetical protein